MGRKLWFASKSLLLDLCYSPTLNLTTSADTRATVTTAVTVSAFLVFKLLTRTSQCRCTLASSPEGGERSPVLTSTNEHLAPEAVHSDALMEWQLLGQNQISAITRFAPQSALGALERSIVIALARA